MAAVDQKPREALGESLEDISKIYGKNEKKPKVNFSPWALKLKLNGAYFLVTAAATASV
jgi:hypothetical protein